MSKKPDPVRQAWDYTYEHMREVTEPAMTAIGRNINADPVHVTMLLWNHLTGYLAANGVTPDQLVEQARLYAEKESKRAP